MGSKLAVYELVLKRIAIFTIRISCEQNDRIFDYSLSMNFCSISTETFAREQGKA